MDKNIYAAIAMALYEYQGNNVHDKEQMCIRDRLYDSLFGIGYDTSRIIQ